MPGALVQVKLVDVLPDGVEVPRAAKFYAAVNVGQLWVFRCVGPVDGSVDSNFDAVMSSVEFDRP